MTLSATERRNNGFVADSDGRQIVVGSSGALTDGLKTVASTATPEALTATSTVVHFVDIQAHSSNTAALTVGTSAVVHGTTTQRGVKLNAGDVWTAYGVDLSTVYVDVGVNGEGVAWLGVVR